MWIALCIFLVPGRIQAVPQFDIFTQDPKLKQEVESAALKSYAQISAFIEDSLTHPVTIYIAENNSDFKSKLGSDFPDWGIGAAVSGHNLIVLKSPAKFRYNRPYSEVLEHELAHIFMDKETGNATPPRWLDEGFAMLESREWQIGQDILIVRAVFTNSIIPLSQIEDLNSFSNSQAELAYTESYLAVSYFLDQYGKESFFRLLNYLSTGQALDLAFSKATGESYIGFQAGFVDFLKKKYNWLAFLGDNILFWLVLAFLLVFLYFMKRYYNRKTIKRWEYEDKIGKYGHDQEDQAPD
ncbi:MAG TPA: peptidase MA family metallohydrolase [Terriglobales bacterium]|nr:peptidase MA family metallohydrolase [Terriglobales bacterium]